VTAVQTAQPAIIFGTDGWRARVGEDYTYENVRRCAQGVAEWVIEQGVAAKGVVIGYDRRFSSEYFAAAAAEVLLAYDIPVALGNVAVPTQMTSFEVVEQGFACGVMITASHNPWMDNGFKIKSPTGAAAGPDILAVVEHAIRAHADETPPVRALAEAEAAGRVQRYDPFEPYRAFVGRSLDLERLRSADMRVLVEPLWGSGAGYIPRLLAGGRIAVHEIHSERNPWFGGVNPEPIRPNIDEALGILADGGFDLGLLLDGDADRAGAADERGAFIHQLQVMGLLMYYLAEHRGMRQPVVSTINETSMVGRLGERYGVPVFETPVGFKYVGPKMIETGAMMGGEESGGFGFGMHLPERDGIYADLMLLDLFMREREAGRWPVSKAVAHLHEIAGPSFYLRTDVHAQRATYPALKDGLLVELREQAPTTLAGQTVVRTDALDTNDGFKFWIGDGSWLLVRFSGTEPLVRIYVEATSAGLRDELLAEGGRMLGNR
jgi:phosphomannomutase